MSAHGWILLGSLLLGALLSMVPTVRPVAFAATDPTAGCLGRESTSPGRDGVLVVDCAPGFATAHDRVYVYPRAPLPSSQDWRASMNATDAVWVFDVGARDAASLMIDFHPNRNGPGLVADLYDDQDGDGNVRYRMVDGIPVPAESAFPTVRVVAPDGWWTRGALVNFNLNVTVDGPVDAAFGSETYINRLKNDGRPDFEIQVRDPDHDGRPDEEWIDAWPDAPQGWGILRTQLMVNTNHDEAPIADAIFWPYLGTSYQPAPGRRNVGPTRFALAPVPGATDGFIKGYGTSFPPIQVWWPGAEIANVGEFIASRGNGANWFLYSLNRLDRGRTGLADFETPFAFYDLAQAHDGYPDLAIRQEYYPARDPYFDGGQFGQPSQLIRYSWDQFHAHAWSYKLDLLGRQPITSTVKVGPLSIATVPYSQYPTWVTSRRWDAADFVAAEPGVWTSEGIYAEVFDSATLWTGYLTGITSDVPTADLDAVPAGYRGELAMSPGDRVELYVSSIDRKLHLLRATAGIWNVDGRTKIRYANLGGDYLNQWTRLENGSEAQSLTYVSNQLLLIDATGLRIKTVDGPAATFQTPPPTGHAEWARLGASLARPSPTLSGDDLPAMFDQFPGPTQTLLGATVRDLRVTPDGFRFALRLPSDPDTVARRTGGPAPGDYLVRFTRAAGYSVTPLEPVAIDISAVAIPASPPIALNPEALAVTLGNRSNQDATGVKVRFLASHGGAKEVAIGSTSLDVPAGGSARTSIRWTPLTGGDWTVRATASAPFVSKGVTRVSVAAAPSTDLRHLLALEPPGGHAGLAAVVLFGMILLLAGGLVLTVLLVPKTTRATFPPGTGHG
ncbi:MAG: hypothetical protein ACRDIY_17730 [Chloroflexota bacterium]